MVDGDATDESNDKGKEDNSDTETPKTPYQSREEEYTKLKQRNKDIQDELILGEKLKNEALLGGDNGGNVLVKEMSQEQIKIQQAAEFFKGTQLEKDIIKANEKQN